MRKLLLLVPVALAGCVLVPPSWSPDGKSVAVLMQCTDGRAKGREHQVWVLGAGRASLLVDGRARQLEAREGGLGAPAWSPDGKRIAWSAGNEVVLWDVEGRRRSVLEAGGAFGEKDLVVYGMRALAWVPGSNSLVGTFLRAGADPDGPIEERLVVKRWDAGGGEAKTLLEHADLSWCQPSPDGRWILGIEKSGWNGETRTLVLLPTAGGERRVLTGAIATNTFSLYAAWAPDGQSIAVSYAQQESDRGNRTGVAIIGLDGEELRFLPTPSSDVTPLVYGWPAKGKGVLAVLDRGDKAANEIAWIDPQTAKAMSIASAEGYPSVGCLALSPDGARVAYCVSGELIKAMPAWRIRTLADGSDRWVQTTAQNAAAFLGGMLDAIDATADAALAARIREAALRDARVAREAYPDEAAIAEVEKQLRASCGGGK